MVEGDIFAPALLGGAVVKALDYLANYILDSFKQKKTLQNCKIKISSERRFDHIEKIFLTLEKANTTSIINRDLTETNNILEEISKNAIARTLYFSNEENKMIDRLIDTIKSNVGNKTISQTFRTDMEILKTCLGVDYASQK